MQVHASRLAFTTTHNDVPSSAKQRTIEVVRLSPQKPLIPFSTVCFSVLSRLLNRTEIIDPEIPEIRSSLWHEQRLAKS